MTARRKPGESGCIIFQFKCERCGEMEARWRRAQGAPPTICWKCQDAKKATYDSAYHRQRRQRLRASA